jgi:hypothetical protein
MDRQKAALTVVAVEQGKLLMPVHDIGRVVAIESNSGGRPGIAGAIEIDHDIGHAHHLAPGRRVLPARHRRLRAQIVAAVGQAVAGQLEGRVSAQMVEVVGIFVAAGDGEDAGAQDVIDAVGDKGRVARVRDQPRQLRRDPQAPLHHAEQQHAAIRGDAPAVKGGDQLLAANGWKTKGRIVSSDMAGVARCVGVDGMASTPNP